MGDYDEDFTDLIDRGNAVRADYVDPRFCPRVGKTVEYAPTIVESLEPSCAAIITRVHSLEHVDLFVIVPPGSASEGRTFFKERVRKIDKERGPERGPEPAPFDRGRWRWPL